MRIPEFNYKATVVTLSGTTVYESTSIRKLAKIIGINPETINRILQDRPTCRTKNWISITKTAIPRPRIPVTEILP
jgi:hypothetical protein